MNYESQFIIVGGVRIKVVRKRIKHLYLRVGSPTGEVRASVPWQIDAQDLIAEMTKKLDWICRKQAELRARRMPPEPRLLSGEHHLLGGTSYPLKVIIGFGKEGVSVRDGTIELRVRPEAGPARREVLFDRWRRDRLRQMVQDLALRWLPAIGVAPVEWRIRRMKTRWGSCNPRARRIWLNLELVKAPVDCLEYVLVHELLHLFEPRHDQRFFALLDRHLPHWRSCRERLRSLL